VTQWPIQGIDWKLIATHKINTMTVNYLRVLYRIVAFAQHFRPLIVSHRRFPTTRFGYPKFCSVFQRYSAIAERPRCRVG